MQEQSQTLDASRTIGTRRTRPTFIRMIGEVILLSRSRRGRSHQYAPITAGTRSVLTHDQAIRYSSPPHILDIQNCPSERIRCSSDV